MLSPSLSGFPEKVESSLENKKETRSVDRQICFQY